MNDSAHVYTGSCLCGAVAFDIEGELEAFYLCHCSRCRKESGSAHGAKLFSTTARLKWRQGRDKVTRFTLPSTRHSRSFCSICGSGVPDVQMDGALLVVPAGCLDSGQLPRPTAHIFTGSRAGWDQALETVPSAEGSP